MNTYHQCRAAAAAERMLSAMNAKLTCAPDFGRDHCPELGPFAIVWTARP